MATRRHVRFERKIALEVVQAEDGQYCADASMTKSGMVGEWTAGLCILRPADRTSEDERILHEITVARA